LALSPEGIASLANLGLVKRAQREIAAGEGPALEEDAAGVVTGTFNDGVVARLIPGRSLRDAPCSCGAVTVCRHRVAVALAYPAWHASSVADPSAGWSPADFTDEDLERAVGKRVMERAQGVASAGIVIEVRPAGGGPGDVPTARLPTCAVRFLVPRDLAYARCDCALTTCEHVVLAAWAFREVMPGDPAGSPLAPRTIELGRGRAGAPLARPLDPALSSALALAREVLIEGVANVKVEHLAPRFTLLRASLSAASLVWPASIVADIESSLEAYRARSARYRAAVVASCFTELHARARAASGQGELPARLILGADEVKETLLDHVRLLSLGARVFADGIERVAEVYLADPGSGVVLVLKKRFMIPEDAAREDGEGPALAKRGLAGGIALGSLAAGQIVSRALKRFANRSVEVSNRRGQSSVAPHGGDFSVLPASLLVRDLGDLERSRRAEPPRMLRPRVLAEAMRVIEIARVGEVGYRPGEQELCAELFDARGGSILLVRRHEGVAPGAIDALARALLVDKNNPVHFVSGEIRRGRFGLEIEPSAIVTDRVIVPDLEPPRPIGALLPTAVLTPTHVSAPLDDAAARAAACLEEACHLGLARVGAAWSAQASDAAGALNQVGLIEASRRLRRLIDRVGELRRERSGAGEKTSAHAEPSAAEAAAAAWLSTSIRIALVREAL
jgi:hypothetical protein